MSDPVTTFARRLPAGEHYGSARSLLRTGELDFAASVYSGGSATAWHSHERACFTALLGGSYREEFRSVSLECTPGNVLFRPADAVHRDHMGPAGARCLIVELSPAWMARVWEAGLALNTPHQSREMQFVLARIFKELNLDDDLSPLVLEGLVLELAGSFWRALRSEAQPPRWLAETRDRLQQDFLAPQRLGELAAQAGVHPAHLARAFRRHYGCTVGDFIRQRRVGFACAQLQAGKSSLAAIGLAAGFASQAHFSRVFKAMTGMTPGQYQEAVAPTCKSQTKPSIA
ncbi:MAG TPA: AraC family transcriptional regulator [Terriglobales bacterium]|nr:AraC family transcriptional regulator [Terriglobales bacterium]